MYEDRLDKVLNIRPNPLDKGGGVGHLCINTAGKHLLKIGQTIASNRASSHVH